MRRAGRVERGIQVAASRSPSKCAHGMLHAAVSLRRKHCALARDAVPVLRAISPH
ncbi:hypothetical protein BDW60DRAFT_181008 [Aspergillus nidulans var. acristatus]